MRKTVLLFLMLFAVSMPLKAQGVGGWKLSSMTVTTGKGVLSSGLNLGFLVEKRNRTIEAAGDDGQGWVNYAWTFFDSKLAVGATGGLLMNTPLVGPRIDWKPLPGLMLMTWPAISVGPKFGAPGFDLNPGVKSGFAFYTRGNFTASYAVLKFEGNKVQHIPGGAIDLKIDAQRKVFFGVDYDLTNDDVLWRMGFGWTAPKSSQSPKVAAGSQP